VTGPLALLRLALFVSALAACYGLWVLGRPLAALARRSGDWAPFMLTAWARTTAAILCLRVETAGRPPTPPFFLVANHLGYVDAILLASRFPVRFVARADVRHWPVFGRIADQAGTLFVERTRRRAVVPTAAAMEAVLAGGGNLVLFPEGTSSDGAAVLPFHSALLAPAASTAQPVSYAALGYATPPGQPPAADRVCWWGDMTFGDHFLGLLGLTSVRGWIRFGPGPVTDRDRKALAARLEAGVRAVFRPSGGRGTVPRSAPGPSGAGLGGGRRAAGWRRSAPPAILSGTREEAP
jgi:1-acyl-sn-glycerol-3-phosphate acyltransferase